MTTEGIKENKYQTKGIRIQDGHIYICFTYPKNIENREPFGIDTPDNRESAQDKLYIIKKDIKHKCYKREEHFKSKEVAITKTTVHGFGQTWIDSLSHELNTMRSYRTAMKKLNLWFGGVELKDLLPIQIQNSIKKSGLSPKTQKNYVCVLSALYESAIDNKLVVSNPCGKVKLPKLLTPEDTIDPFERPDMALILDYLFKKNEQYFNLVSFMVETGLRPQEVPLLEYKDIDFTTHTIRISKAVDADQSKKGTKTGKVRLVDLTDKAIASLNSQKKHTYKTENSLIFLGVKSKRQLHMRVFRVTVWIPALVALGIRKRPLYSLRHTFGSQLVSDCLPMKYISEQLGHATTATTERHYAKWMISSNAKMLELRNRGKTFLKVIDNDKMPESRNSELLKVAG